MARLQTGALNRYQRSASLHGVRNTGSLVCSIFALLIIIPASGHIADAQAQIPPRLDIYHFDVNTGDATLILSPDGQGVLIDAGDHSRGHNRIPEFLNRASDDGRLTSLDYFIATHYDSDHIAGADELLKGEWYPSIQVLDRGDTLLPSFDRSFVENSCGQVDPDTAEAIAPWGSAPTSFCPRRASCEIVEYFVAAESGGSRATLRPGDSISLDHGVELTAIVVNAIDIEGDTVNVDFAGRRDDCAANDLSVGLLLAYGDFRYMIAGDLTATRHRVWPTSRNCSNTARQISMSTTSTTTVRNQLLPRLHAGHYANCDDRVKWQQAWPPSEDRYRGADSRR